MNRDIIQGKWKQLAGQAKAQWNKLTDDDLGVADGHRDYLVGKLQERYGWERERAETEVKQFESRLH
ncbi:CsbD family protein [Tahibacter caeni]|uniref:CsbD family protein n=1 Tax=Tahibacter caeni TaxID=1453545 RepID=UPI002148E057|nr:CsbD family protein [Tahibacter caeni]